MLSGQDPRAGSDEVSFVKRFPIFDLEACEAAFLALPCRTHGDLGSGLGADKVVPAQKMKPASRRLTDDFMLINVRMSFRGFAFMRATHSFILGLDHLLLSVASAATGNHWYRFTPQAMLTWLPDARSTMCVLQVACPKLGNHLREVAMLVDLSNNRRGEVHLPRGHECPSLEIANHRLSVAYLVGSVRSLDIDRPVVDVRLCPASLSRGGSTDGLRRRSYPAPCACWILVYRTIAAENELAKDSHEISTPWPTSSGVQHYQLSKKWGKRDKRPEGGDLEIGYLHAVLDSLSLAW